MAMATRKRKFTAAQVRDILTATQDSDNSDLDGEESIAGDSSDESSNDDDDTDVAQADSGSDLELNQNATGWINGSHF